MSPQKQDNPPPPSPRLFCKVYFIITDSCRRGTWCVRLPHFCFYGGRWSWWAAIFHPVLHAHVRDGATPGCNPSHWQVFWTTCCKGRWQVDSLSCSETDVDAGRKTWYDVKHWGASEILGRGRQQIFLQMLSWQPGSGTKKLRAGPWVQNFLSQVTAIRAGGQRDEQMKPGGRGVGVWMVRGDGLVDGGQPFLSASIREPRGDVEAGKTGRRRGRGGGGEVRAGSRPRQVIPRLQPSPLHLLPMQMSPCSCWLSLPMTYACSLEQRLKP